jgi:hypothetical protein
MKSIYLILLLFCANGIQAHEPELSNLMIYEQNGAYFLVIKSSLSAFDGEINYLFGKNAYKSPEGFQQLVIKHLQNNCLVIINEDTVELDNPKVLLGHETTIFSELSNTPKKFNTIYVKNTFFKNMPENTCELILTIKGLPQKQYILNSGNKHEVKMKVINDNWTIMKASDSLYTTLNLIFYVLLALTVSVIVITAIKKIKKGSGKNINLSQ